MEGLWMETATSFWIVYWSQSHLGFGLTNRRKAQHSPEIYYGIRVLGVGSSLSGCCSCFCLTFQMLDVSFKIEYWNKPTQGPPKHVAKKCSDVDPSSNFFNLQFTCTVTVLPVPCVV